MVLSLSELFVSLCDTSFTCGQPPLHFLNGYIYVRLQKEKCTYLTHIFSMVLVNQPQDGNTPCCEKIITAFCLILTPPQRAEMCCLFSFGKFNEDFGKLNEE